MAEPMLVADTPTLEQLVRDACGADAYALDTEFHGEGTYYPALALIQLAIPGRVAVIDATRVDVRCLQPLVDGPGVAVTHAGRQDLEIMQRACDARPARVFDTQIAAGFLGFATPSLATLTAELLGRRLEKGQQMSDWFHRPLTHEQIAYAAADVAHLLELRAVIEARLAGLGRLQWALEECERLIPPRIADDATAWWRLKGSSRLKAAARGRAQELAAWRERAARAADRPPTKIIHDDVVVALAEQPPRSVADFPKSRQFDPRRLSTATVGELIAAAARGADLRPEDIRLQPDRLPAHLHGLAALITTWVQQQARDLSIDPGLITRGDIESFLRDEPDCRLREGWRADVVGSAVERIADGRAAVAYDGHGSLILVDR
jgi:ribonuclease D